MITVTSISDLSTGGEGAVGFLWISERFGLHGEFPASQGYTVRSGLKDNKQNKTEGDQEEEGGSLLLQWELYLSRRPCLAHMTLFWLFNAATTDFYSVSSLMWKEHATKWVKSPATASISYFIGFITPCIIEHGYISFYFFRGKNP